MADEKDQKWGCEYCTYKNWQAAKKCTICQAPRPPKFITESGEAQDIYQVGSLASTPPQPEPIKHKQSANTVKWSCSKCTYLNWSRSKKCTVCLCPRPQEGQLIPTMQPLTVNIASTSGSNELIASNRTSPNNRNSPCTSPHANRNNDKNTALASVMKNYQNKWMCKVCTYENWPKASKCSICATARSNSIQDIASISPALSPNSTHSPPNSPRGAAACAPSNRPRRAENLNSTLYKIHDRLSELDWLWLKACASVTECDRLGVEAYLGCGGDVARQLTLEEVSLLGGGNKFKKGHTLVHLAIQSEREDILALLLTASVTSKTRKRLPPHTCPDLAQEILRTVACSLRQRKGDFPCFFLQESVTYALPVDIEDLLPTVKKQLLSDILDQDVQRELEIEESVINWSLELCDSFGSRLYALWNRSAGDCLLDSVLQATWGVFDKDNTLRLALSDSLTEGAMTFYPRWKEYESRQAQLYEFTLDEQQWNQDWSYILSLARQPGSALEQTHIFALAHILRRPIIVYGVKYVKSFRGESIDLAKFQGIYLPLLWEPNFCWKSPIALGYTRGHFSALVPMETDPYKNMGAGAPLDNNDEKVVYLPLIEKDGLPLPLHFLSQSQMKRDHTVLQDWLICREIAGVMCAEQQYGRRPPLVQQMTEEWLDRYRHLSQAMLAAGMGRRVAAKSQESCDTDEE